MVKRLSLLLLPLLLFNCTHTAQKQVQTPQPAPPQVAQNVFILLPEPDGKTGSVVVANSAGTETLTQPYQAVRVAGAGAAPTPPFTMDQAGAGRMFGAVVNDLPTPQVSFLLYFGEGSELLTRESQAQLPFIFDAIRERHSTFISLIGHTDTTATPQFNYQLGLRRAQTVAAIIRQRGAAASDLFVESHGEADLLVKTARGVSNVSNRRVEIIVR